MKAITMKVRDYFLGKSNLLNIDSEMLEKAIESLTDEEYAILNSNDDPAYKPYNFILHKVFYRHNDLCAGHSDIDDDGEIICSAQSGVTELDISMETYEACYAAGYLHIEDIDKEDFSGFSFEVIADLTAAIIKFEAVHQVLLED